VKNFGLRLLLTAAVEIVGFVMSEDSFVGERQVNIAESQAAVTPDPATVSRRSRLPFISFVTPVFNEEVVIDSFVETISSLIQTIGCRYEIVFVNDGSHDMTLQVLRKAKVLNPAIVIISLSRNFGKEAALTAGLDYAKGDVVIPIDVDLQDPPELVHKFLEQWRAGADVVFGVRNSRASDSAMKRATANWFYTLFNLISPLPIPANVGDFRLMDRRVVNTIKNLHERNRFMKGLMSWPGFKTETVEFERKPRSAGDTHWSYWKLWNFALDGITSFSTAPLRLWLYVGAVVSVLSFLYAGFIVIRVLVYGGDVPGYPSLMVAIIFFGGIQLVSIGLVGEYVGRIFHEIKGRPIYIVDTLE
jgi:polyisoprenyl-phosphate glycosyltransferase